LLHIKHQQTNPDEALQQLGEQEVLCKFCCENSHGQIGTSHSYFKISARCVIAITSIMLTDMKWQ
jgi:hypothetical protein